MSVKFGIHPFIWTDHWGNDTLNLIDHAKNIGFDYIEVPLLKLDITLARKVNKYLQSLNMSCVGSTAITEKTNITSSDKSLRTAGINWLKAAVENTAEMGGRLMTGVIYAPFGKTS